MLVNSRLLEGWQLSFSHHLYRTGRSQGSLQHDATALSLHALLRCTHCVIASVFNSPYAAPGTAPATALHALTRFKQYSIASGCPAPAIALHLLSQRTPHAIASPAPLHPPLFEIRFRTSLYPRSCKHVWPCNDMYWRQERIIRAISLVPVAWSFPKLQRGRG